MACDLLGEAETTGASQGLLTTLKDQRSSLLRQFRLKTGSEGSCGDFTPPRDAMGVCSPAPAELREAAWAQVERGRSCRGVREGQGMVMPPALEMRTGDGGDEKCSLIHHSEVTACPLQIGSGFCSFAMFRNHSPISLCAGSMGYHIASTFRKNQGGDSLVLPQEGLPPQLKGCPVHKTHLSAFL